MNAFTNPLLSLGEYASLLDSIKSGENPVKITGPSESQKAHVVYSLSQHLNGKCVVITYNDIQARRLFEDISFFAGNQALLLQPKEMILFSVAAKNNDIVFNRLSVLKKIADGDFSIVVASIDAMVGKLMPPDMFARHTVNLKAGQEIRLEPLLEELVVMGYESTGIVEGKGQFSRRGGILDVFPVNGEYAVRIEFFDDIIDSLRFFDVETQRSVQHVESVSIIPASELIIEYDAAQRVADCIGKELQKASERLKSIGDAETLGRLTENVNEDIENIKNLRYFAGMDKYAPVIAERPSGPLDYFRGDTIVFFDEPSRCAQRTENLLSETGEAVKDLMEKGMLLPSHPDMLWDFEDLISRNRDMTRVLLESLPSSYAKMTPKKTYNIISRTLGSYRGKIDILTEEIGKWKKEGYGTIILAGTGAKGQKLSETLLAEGIENSYTEAPPETVYPGQLIVMPGGLNSGFEYPEAKLAVVSDSEIFGRDRRQARRRSRDGRGKIKAFTDLSIGDYVVHYVHGIGQYTGIEKLVVEGITKDYLKIRYMNGDYLYIPTMQMDLIQKYVGAGGKPPRLSKLGGGDWTKTRTKVKESLKEFAGELVKLYAERHAAKGYAFSPDTVWQAQFEGTFPYEETPDQLRSIEEVKRDMEMPKPMERLLCGDVGYGKTEVAIRAAFKAVMDGKQVAYLVPTTILAQQHYNNFIERMRDFPVKVDVLSRFRSEAEQRDILKALKSGNIDILIGTHRLLQKDVVFKELGLLIVDEEHRFGVSQKEALKNIKKNVDVLSLTATPIPRTLHMSLTGIRDISTIEDPPEDRYPVQTYVMEYDRDVIRDAIIREIGRKGQVFYLYNRVRTIYRKANEIAKMVPDARIAVAHGKMNEGALEDVMYDFVQGNYDILVCTTIIESGLDIQNVNTIIIEDADRMGLAQLYQLRGRVGRANRLSHAYITYLKDKVLSEEATKRLQAIKEFTEFGSGFRIAMRDLEIRGAGNLLGPEQHGHMEAVGYEMYCRLLEEAVGELRGEPVRNDMDEVTIDINVSAYIDNSYIGDELQRIEVYKKIASIHGEDDVIDIKDELIDRYGDIPEAVENLIEVARIKTLARDAKITSVTHKNGNVILQFKEPGAANFQVISRLVGKYGNQILFTASGSPYISYRAGGQTGAQVLKNIKFILQDIKSFAV